MLNITFVHKIKIPQGVAYSQEMRHLALARCLLSKQLVVLMARPLARPCLPLRSGKQARGRAVRCKSSACPPLSRLPGLPAAGKLSPSLPRAATLLKVDCPIDRIIGE
jgi:hypothetical protein